MNLQDGVDICLLFDPGHQNYLQTQTSSNMTTSVAVAPTDTLPALILKQVEFYFSDANLPSDKFLLAETKKNSDGWVPISIIASFARMKKLSQDVDVIIEALQSKVDGLLEVDDTKTQVRRRIPVPESRDSMSCTVYLKHYPKEASLDDIQASLHEQGVSPLVIRMRRFLQSKDFRGSVFVELASEEVAKDVMNKQLSYKGNKLSIETKAQYLQRKNDERVKGGKRVEKIEFVPGCLLVIDNVVLDDHKELKAMIDERAPIAFVELKDGKALIRLKEPKTDDVLSLGDIQLGELSLTPRKATETEEKEYYERLAVILSEKTLRQKRTRRGTTNNRKRCIDVDGSEECNAKATKVCCDEEQEHNSTAGSAQEDEQ